MARNQDTERSGKDKGASKMTVQEAGKMGGQRVRELVEEGKRSEEEGGAEEATSERGESSERVGGSKH